VSWCASDSCNELQTLSEYENRSFDCSFSSSDPNAGPLFGGPHVSSCGHQVHVKCHANYIETINRDDLHFPSSDPSRVFRCPLCRRTSNLLIPCNIKACSEPEVSGQDMLGWLHRPHRSDSFSRFNLSRVCRRTVTDIHETMCLFTSSPYLMTPSSPAILRAMTEHQLLMLGGTLLNLPVSGSSSSPPRTSTDKKLPIGEL